MWKNFWKAVKESFKSRWGWAIGLISFVCGTLTIYPIEHIGLWLKIQNNTLRKWIAVTMIAVFITNIIYRIIKNLLLMLRDAENAISPMDFRFPVIHYEEEDDKDLFYVDFNDALRVDAIVSIYYYRKPNSRIVCNGIVVDSEPGESVTIQVIPNSTRVGREKDFDIIKSTDENIHNCTYVLPIIQKKDFIEIKDYIQ